MIPEASLFRDIRRHRMTAAYRRFGIACVGTNCQPTLRNIPEERRQQLHRLASLKPSTNTIIHLPGVSFCSTSAQNLTAS
jgi:hypothetical protein